MIWGYGYLQERYIVYTAIDRACCQDKIPGIMCLERFGAVRWTIFKMTLILNEDMIKLI